MNLSNDKLKGDLAEILELVSQREEQLIKILNALSKFQNREATIEMIDNTIGKDVVKVEPLRVSREDKIVSGYVKYSATKLEDQRNVRDFIEKVIDLYHSIDGRYTKLNLQLVSKEASRSLRSLIETLQNLLSKPVIEFEIALLSVLRQSRSRLAKELECLKQFAINVKSELVASVKIGEVKSLKLSPRKIKLPSEIKSPEKSKGGSNKDSTKHLRKMLQTSVSKTSVQSPTNSHSITENRGSPMKDQNETPNDFGGSPKRSNFSHFVNSSNINENTTMKAVSSRLPNAQMEKPAQPYELMGIDYLHEVKSTYQGTRQINKYLNEIEELIDRANKGNPNQKYLKDSFVDDRRKENHVKKNFNPDTKLSLLYKNFSSPRKYSNDNSMNLVHQRQISAFEGNDTRLQSRKPAGFPNLIVKDKILEFPKSALFGEQHISSARLTTFNIFGKLSLQKTKTEEIFTPIKNQVENSSVNFHRRRGTESSKLSISRLGNLQNQLSPKGIVSPKESIIVKKIHAEAALNTLESKRKLY